MGGIQAVVYVGDLKKNIYKLWHFEIFVNTGQYGAGMFK